MHFELSPLIVWIALWIVDKYAEFQVNISSNNGYITKCLSFCTTPTSTTTPRLKQDIRFSPKTAELTIKRKLYLNDSLNGVTHCFEYHFIHIIATTDKFMYSLGFTSTMLCRSNLEPPGFKSHTLRDPKNFIFRKCGNMRVCWVLEFSPVPTIFLL